MKLVPLLSLLALLAFPALAAEEHAKAEGGEKGEKKGGKPGTNVDLQFSRSETANRDADVRAEARFRLGNNVDMPFLMAPMTDADGKLTGYAYITSRLTASSEAIVTDVREKLPFIQDLLLRDVNNSPVTMPDDPKMVNIPGLEARLLAGARKVMGAAKVKTVTVCTVQIADLRPKQTPALHTPPEKSRCES